MSFTLSVPETKLLPKPVRGIVEKPITPQYGGRVRALGSSWRAEWFDPTTKIEAAENSLVQIVGMRGITLLVVLLER